MIRVSEGIPNWDCEGDFISQYCSELEVVTTVNQLKAFVTRWKLIWEVEDATKAQHVRKMDSLILKGEFSEEDLQCLRLSFEISPEGEGDIPCEHTKAGRLCPGLEIRLPWSQLRALGLAKHFGVPVNVAFHQAFCTDDHHSNCF
jgi:hypothetical protein